MNLILLALGIYLMVAAIVLLALTILCVVTERTWAGMWMVAGVSLTQMIHRSLMWPYTAYLIISALRRTS